MGRVDTGTENGSNLPSLLIRAGQQDHGEIDETRQELCHGVGLKVLECRSRIYLNCCINNNRIGKRDSTIEHTQPSIIIIREHRPLLSSRPCCSRDLHTWIIHNSNCCVVVIVPFLLCDSPRFSTDPHCQRKI